MFTRDGGWSFIKIYDAIAQLLGPRERLVYLELARTAVRKNQTRVIEWRGSALALREGELLIRIRELAPRLRLSRITLTRTLEGLGRKRVVRFPDKSRGEAGGVLLYVCKPDDIPHLIARRVVHLGHLRDKVSRRENWEKDPDLKERWAILGHLMGQLNAALPKQYQMEFQLGSTNGGPSSGPIEVLRHRNSLSEAELKAALSEFDASFEKEKDAPGVGETDRVLAPDLEIRLHQSELEKLNGGQQNGRQDHHR